MIILKILLLIIAFGGILAGGLAGLGAFLAGLAVLNRPKRDDD